MTTAGEYRQRRHGDCPGRESPEQMTELSDAAIDLVLGDMGEDGERPSLGPAVVEAIIGVLDTSALAAALNRDVRSLDVWHSLVVSTGGAATVRTPGGLLRHGPLCRPYHGAYRRTPPVPAMHTGQVRPEAGSDQNVAGEDSEGPPHFTASAGVATPAESSSP